MILRIPLQLALTVLTIYTSSVHAATRRRALTTLSTPELGSLAALKDLGANVEPASPMSHLSRILIPRAPGTDNNTKVRDYIADTMRALGWKVELDQFTDKTPYGEKHFANVIATKDPTAARRVILAAHFDSKFFATFPESQFLGATDSAAPCAMMLDLAEALDPLLDRRKALQDAAATDTDSTKADADPDDVTLQLVWFDGEEAFKAWTHTDSVYGARHLAQKWQSAYIDPRQKRRLHPTATELSTIDHLILLDLLGAPRPHIQNYFPSTAWLFDALASAEKRVLDAGLLSDAGGPKVWSAGDSFFVPRTGTERFGGIEDDHIPFLQRGVEILHVIASPFPQVWHTLRDDAAALDLPTMRRWNLVLRVFFSEYFGLRPDLPTAGGTSSSTLRRAEEELVSVGVATRYTFVMIDHYQ